MAAAPCHRLAGLDDDYNDSGYHYQLTLFKLAATANNNVDPAPGSYLTTLQCDQDYKGTMQSGKADYVTFNKGVFEYFVGGDNVNDKKPQDNRTVAPIQIDLGIKPHGTHDTDPQVATWIIPFSVWPSPQLVPPLSPVNGIPSNSTTYARAAEVDDSGRLVIRDNKNVDHTIWCVGLVANPNGFAANNCPPDVKDTTGVNSRNGAGFLYIYDQCVLVGFLSPCDSSGYSKWYLADNMYNGKNGDGPTSSKGTTRLTDLMDKEQSTGYLQNGFYNHMDSRNTQPGGFAAYNYYTLTYPNNSATCSYNQGVGTIDATYKNTGTRIWRDSDGYIVRVKANGTVQSYTFTSPKSSSNLVTNGQSVTFSGIPVPASGGYTIELDQDKDGTGPNGTGSPITTTGHLQSDNNYEVVVSGCTPITALTCVVNIAAFSEIGVGFNFTVTIKNNGSNPTTGPVDVMLNKPNGSLAQHYPGLGITDPLPTGGGTGTTATQSYTPTIGGSYTFVVTYDGVTFSPCGQVTVGNKPYVRIYNGDIFAGSNDSSGSCTNWGSNTDSGIYGFNDLTTGSGKGSGSQLGALALGVINGFASAIIGNGAGSPTLPYDLTFANSPAPPPAGYLGGKLPAGTYPRCPFDYWGNKPNSGLTPTGGGGTIDVDSLTSGIYDGGSGTRRIDVPCSSSPNPNCGIHDGQNITIYVNGDIIIGKNSGGTNGIPYQHTGSWGSMGQIPKLTIIAKGNIKIDSNVTQMDGIYIAQGGTIYTCTNGATTLDSTPDLIYGTCKNQLLVNGALVASRIKWLRTFGTNHDSSGLNDYPGGSSPACSGKQTGAAQPVTSSCAAEIINFTPEVYINDTPGTSSNIDTRFDYITALPPLL